LIRRLTRWSVPVMITMLWVMLSALSFGHAYLESSTPLGDATATATPLRQVSLHFSEPVHINESIFKVYPLQPNDDELALKASATALIAEVMDPRFVGVTDRRNDEDDRVDAGLVASQSPSADIVMRLKEGLKPGPDAVMWKVRSVDTHFTDGWFLFYYEPETDDGA